MDKVKTLPLTQGKLVLVDSEDYELLSQFKWCLHPDGYAVRNSSRKEGRRTAIMLHRFLLNAPIGTIVDHINGNKLDNRKANLRFVTKGQNRSNSNKNKNTKSKYKGVYFCEKQRSKPWRATINSNNMQTHLGYYETEEEAATAYNRAAKIAFGDYAKLNEIRKMVSI